MNISYIGSDMLLISIYRKNILLVGDFPKYANKITLMI